FLHGLATLAPTTLPTRPPFPTRRSSDLANDAASTSPAMTQTVNPAGTSTGLTSSPNPSTFGQSVALTATVSPSAATGTVTFKDGSTSQIKSTLICGTATLKLPTHATCPHTLT